MLQKNQQKIRIQNNSTSITKQIIYNNLSLQERRFALLLADFYSESDQVWIGKAYEHAKRTYEGFLRHDAQPYIIHHIRVAILLVEHKEKNAEIIMAALLKDVPSFGSESIEHIQSLYGDAIAALVKNNMRQLPEGADIEEFKRVVNQKKYDWYANEADADNCKLKSVEIIDNMRCWKFIESDHSSTKKFARWCKEASVYFADITAKAGPTYFETYTDIVDTYKTMPQFKTHLANV